METIEAEDQSQEDLRNRVREALRNVHDPELGVNIVDLGLVYGVDITDGTVHVTYTLTTMGCPIGPLIEAEIRQFVEGIDGVDGVEVRTAGPRGRCLIDLAEDVRGGAARRNDAHEAAMARSAACRTLPVGVQGRLSVTWIRAGR